MMKTPLFRVMVTLSYLSVVMGTFKDVKSVRKRGANLDILSKQDLNKFLDDILSKGKDATPSSCKTMFEEEDGVILRTTDSVKNGAEFLAASDDAQTIDSCREQCCETTSKKTARHCDFVVFQKPNARSDTAKCFLFSCTTEDGEDVCLTTPNSDYMVLRIKEEKVEDQLLDVVANLSKDDGGEVMEGKDKHGICLGQFTKESSTIIRTHDSIENGAMFLKAPNQVNTIEDCQIECCTTTDESSHHCDLAVFQSNDEDPDDRLPRCYLFSCADEDGVSHCVTAPNDGYVAMKRTLDVEENDLDDVISSSTTTTSTPKATETTATTTSATTTTTKHPTTERTPSTTISTTTVKVLPKVPLPPCKRLEWQCDNGECITVTEVCNGKMECSDNSDEIDCQSLLGASPDSSVELKTVDEIEEKVTELPKVSPTSSSSTTTSKMMTTATKKQTLSTKKTTVKTTEVLKKSASVENPSNLSEDEFVSGKTEPQKGAVLPLALGLSVTICVLLMVGCRVHIMKRKLRRRGKPLSMEESDYLINGMYL